MYADGILVCPTYSGAIVGYDLATRSFLWGYRYTEKASADHDDQGASPFPTVVATASAAV